MAKFPVRASIAEELYQDRADAPGAGFREHRVAW
jgi:hypothetical protein